MSLTDRLANTGCVSNCVAYERNCFACSQVRGRTLAVSVRYGKDSIMARAADKLIVQVHTFTRLN